MYFICYFIYFTTDNHDAIKNLKTQGILVIKAELDVK